MKPYSNATNLVISGVILLTILVCYVFLGDLSLAEENGFTENLQAFYCALASAVFLAVFFNTPRLSHFRFFTLVFSALSFAFILRELDIEDFDLPQWAIVIGSGTGRNLLYVAMFMPLLIRLLLNFSRYFSCSIELLKTNAGIFVLSAGLLLISSGVIESTTFELHIIIEELLELGAYMSLLQGALLSSELCRNDFVLQGPWRQ